MRPACLEPKSEQEELKYIGGVDEDKEDQGEEGEGQQREGNEETQEEAERDSLSHGMAMEAGAGDDPGGDGGLSPRRERVKNKTTMEH